MTHENAKEFLPLVQALIEGKTIQGRCGNDWMDLVNPALNEERDHYRIKPEPRRFWVNIYHDGARGKMHASRSDADLVASGERLHCIEVVEVLK